MDRSSTKQAVKRTKNFKNRCFQMLMTGVIASSSFLSQYSFSKAFAAQANAYCHFTSGEIEEKENLRKKAFEGDSQAQKDYQKILKQHGELLERCRSRTWPQDQAVWVRLYPCDAEPGNLDAILDRMVNRGYNQVYLEVFSDSQVLLPAADNPTPWASVLRTEGKEKVDLIAQTIEKGRARGMKVYAWLFTMNFGYAYTQRQDRQTVIARNGRGETNTAAVADESQIFIDPYHRQAQLDFYQLVQAIVKRKPDGVLFDYIRYPRGQGSQSVAGDVKSLWIYGEASRQALYQRASNRQGRALIQRFLNRGYITAYDLRLAEYLYPDDGTPRWQGRNVSSLEQEKSLSPQARQQRIQQELWHLAVAHAAQGVIDFLKQAITPVERQGIPAGAVFFPGANQAVGQQGFDSRLQAWDKFPSSLEWHAMAYAICGQTECIVDEVRRVATSASGRTKVIPALAGTWGKAYNNRPSLEDQMRAIRRVPGIKGVSHFAYSWQEPEFDRDRKFCRL